MLYYVIGTKNLQRWYDTHRPFLAGRHLNNFLGRKGGGEETSETDVEFFLNSDITLNFKI